MVACYKVDYLPVGVGIWFQVNCRVRVAKNVIIYHVWGPLKNLSLFLAIFGHFDPISLEKIDVTPKTRTPQFTWNQIPTPTGK